jgi:polysaccharide biosynthesis/export protein
VPRAKMPGITPGFAEAPMDFLRVRKEGGPGPRDSVTDNIHVVSPESFRLLGQTGYSNKFFRGSRGTSVPGLSTFARIWLLSNVLLVSACFPADGPSSDAIKAERGLGEDPIPYALVKLTSKVVEGLAQYTPRIANQFTDRRAPGDIRLGTGDLVSVTVFEASSGGLFIPAEASARPGNFITIPNQTVDSEGNISIPYAGAVHARGRTVTEVQRTIVDQLKNQAIKPQVVISVVDQRTSMISVLGEVLKPERFPASAAGEHLLDAITRAGGPAGKGYDTWVMLERDGRRATVPFGALVFDPSNNIFVHPNDTIYVYSEPQTFVVFGAISGASGGGTGGQGQFPFGAWRISLAEAVAKAGGLSDVVADPASVFLYRGEPRQVAEEIGVDVSRFDGPIVPVIYQVNFRDPTGYFLAKQFDMRNKDIIYVSNASSVETTKVLTFLRLAMATADDPIVYATTFFTLKTAITGTSTSGTSILVGQ